MTNPVFILVAPQLVENIGMTARAMMNCALTELRLVVPRDPWPLEPHLAERMRAASSGADAILEKATVFSSIEEALLDLNYIYATTSRPHDMVQKIVTPRKAIPDMAVRAKRGERVGILFGCERTGLISDDLVLANERITIPLNPEFASLNLAQAVLLLGYEWYQHTRDSVEEQIHYGKSIPATKEDYFHFFNRLEKELDACGFFVAPAMRPTMTRNLQSVLQRAAMTDQEIRTWHGVITALRDGKKSGTP